MDALQRLLIIEACRDLVLRAAAQADTGDATALAALFTEDAVLARPNAEPLLGRAAIRCRRSRATRSWRSTSQSPSST